MTVGSQIPLPARHLILITFYLGRQVCVMLFKSHDYIDTPCLGKGAGEERGGPVLSSPPPPFPGPSGTTFLPWSLASWGGSAIHPHVSRAAVGHLWGTPLHPTPVQHFHYKRIFFLTCEIEKYLRVHQPLKAQLPQMGSIKNK